MWAQQTRRCPGPWGWQGGRGLRHDVAAHSPSRTARPGAGPRDLLGPVCRRAAGSVDLPAGDFLCRELWIGLYSGGRVFNGVISTAFLLSCSACLLAADAISAERREGTLGLLFLTRIKSLDVLLGKLSSVGITSLCALVAFFPVLMIPVIAGGVTGTEAFRSGLGLFATLAFALGAGLFASAAQRERSRAVRASVLMVLFFVLVPSWLSRAMPPGGWKYIGVVSPLLPLVYARDAAYTAAPALYWASLAGVSALAAGLLILAGLRLRRATSDGGGEVLVPPPALREEEAEKAVGLYRWEPSKEEASPIEWLVYRQQGVSAGMWVPAVVALAYSGLVVWAHQPFAPAWGSGFLAAGLASGNRRRLARGRNGGLGGQPVSGRRAQDRRLGITAHHAGRRPVPGVGPMDGPETALHAQRDAGAGGYVPAGPRRGGFESGFEWRAFHTLGRVTQPRRAPCWARPRSAGWRSGLPSRPGARPVPWCGRSAWPKACPAW